MKRTTLFLFFTTMCLALLSQEKHLAAPAYSITFQKNDHLFSLAEATAIVNEIVLVMNIKSDFEVKEGRVKNIEAIVKKHRQRITYNPQFIKSLQSATANRWAVVALFAHEIGHHFQGHTLKRHGSKPQLELEADEFAGYVLHKLGAPLNDSKMVMHFIASTRTSKTHPARFDRMMAIENGWYRGQKELQILVKKDEQPEKETGSAGTSN